MRNKDYRQIIIELNQFIGKENKKIQLKSLKNKAKISDIGKAQAFNLISKFLLEKLGD